MNQTTEKVVKLKDPVPVFIIYYTAWVDNEGQLNFRDDVYQHDSELIKKMLYRNISVKPKNQILRNRHSVTSDCELLQSFLSTVHH